MEQSVHILFNARAGSVPGLELTAEALKQLFAERGFEVVLDADADLPLTERALRAARSPARLVIAAGGDGTATVAAAALVDGSKSLAVLPLGTANLLARDLHLPLDVEEWFAALPAMRERKIDVGEVNGHLFLHKVVVGTIPGVAAAREHMRGHDTPMARLQLLRHFITRLARASRFALEVRPAGGTPHLARVQAFAVVNNDYDEGLGRFFSRQRLDRGTLSVYMLKRLRPMDAARLTLEMVMGRWRDDEVLSVENVEAVSIRTRRQRVAAMVDGEVIALQSPLQFRLRPLALTVLAPPPSPDAETAVASKEAID